MIHLKLEDLQKAAMDKPGMLQAFIQAGELQGDRVVISREAFDELNDHYFKGLKLGSVLHAIIQPVAKAADKALGTKLQDCGGCAGRELKMNAVTS